ncbi:MAG: hypothetical protein NO483_02705 [Candidatus Methanomethylicia archaeon]|nr:hypothetical protein [Candidatus Methanomethylicia archaeon]
MITTKIFDRLPSDAGVTFEGFENIKLKSRESIREKLDDFVNYCKDARKPAVRVILGEWGEGKTDAFRRYIEPRAKDDGNYAFLVSTSTLLNEYESPYISDLLKSTSLSAVKFLVVLFNAVRDECGEEKIPDPRNYKDAIIYLDATLNNLIGEKKTKRIFIFIDEFEELLLFQQRLRDIISGIKETINGMYKAIDEGGEYEGCVHLIIAATPDAFYKLQVTEDFSLIFGSLGRRIGVIELPQIRKEEGITFLFELLKYAYRENLPYPLPINNFGIFNVLFRITQGNPGNLVSLFTRLMNSARIDEKTIKVIDYEDLLRFLEKESVFVYGGSTACLEKETFDRLLKIIGDQSKKETGEKCILLLKMIVGELKPFSVNELEERVRYKNIMSLINIINETLKKKEGIERAILKVSPYNIDGILKDLKDFIVKRDDDRYIQIDNYLEQMDAFIDRVSYFTYENGNIIQKVYLPSDKYSIMSFFEGITHDRAEEIENIIKRKLSTDEVYYIASDELLSQIFPTPIPRELGFIKNRDKRLKLWREVTRNLAREYESNMPKAFIYILNKSGLFSVNGKEYRKKQDGILACIAELKMGEININTIFFPVNGDVKGTDIEELWNLKKEKKTSHCALLIFTGEITSEAREKIENKGMGRNNDNFIIEVHIHPTLIKRIICIYKTSFMPTEEINEELFKNIITRIVERELNIQGRLNDWLKDQEKRGVVVKLQIRSTSSLKEFADTLKFFINFIEYEGTLEEIFDKNQELLRYVQYGVKKVGLIPDIQFPKFSDIAYELLENGFLTKSGEGKYKVQSHPVENRILKILQKERKVSIKDLEKFFIIENTRHLSDIFLPILEYKGLIRKEDNYYLLTDKDELYGLIKRDYERLKNEVKQYQNYGYVYMVKERGERLISLTEFKSFIDKLYEQLESVELNEQIELQKLSLIKRLLEHFFDDLQPLIREASKRCNDIITNIRSFQFGLEELISKIKEKYDKWLKLQFEVENLEEYKEIQKLFKDIKEHSEYTDEGVKEIIKKFDDKDKKNFVFSKKEEEAFYFNPKLYIIHTLFEKAKEKKERIEKAVEELIEEFDSFEKKQQEIESKLKTKEVDRKYIISYSILDILKQLTGKNILPSTSPYRSEKLSIKDLQKCVQSNIDVIKSNLKYLEECTKRFSDLYNAEKEFIDFLEENTFLSSFYLSVFDIENYSNIARNFDNDVKEIEEEYKSYLQDIQLEEPQLLLKKTEEIRNKVDKLKKKLEDKRKIIDLRWNNYITEMKNSVSDIEHVLMGLQKLISDDNKIRGIEEKLNNIKKHIDYINAKKTIEHKLSELENMKQDIHNTLYVAVKDILTLNELRLIEYIVGKLKGKKKAWLPVEEVYQFVENELKVDRSETSRMLKRLSDLKILQEGITLAF